MKKIISTVLQHDFSTVKTANNNQQPSLYQMALLLFTCGLFVQCIAYILGQINGLNFALDKESMTYPFRPQPTNFCDNPMYKVGTLTTAHSPCLPTSEAPFLPALDGPILNADGTQALTDSFDGTSGDFHASRTPLNGHGNGIFAVLHPTDEIIDVLRPESQTEDVPLETAEDVFQTVQAQLQFFKERYPKTPLDEFKNYITSIKDNYFHLKYVSQLMQHAQIPEGINTDSLLAEFDDSSLDILPVLLGLRSACVISSNLHQHPFLIHLAEHSQEYIFLDQVFHTPNMFTTFFGKTRHIGQVLKRLGLISNINRPSILSAFKRFQHYAPDVKDLIIGKILGIQSPNVEIYSHKHLFSAEGAKHCSQLFFRLVAPELFTIQESEALYSYCSTKMRWNKNWNFETKFDVISTSVATVLGMKKATMFAKKYGTILDVPASSFLTFASATDQESQYINTLRRLCWMTVSGKNNHELVTHYDPDNRCWDLVAMKEVLNLILDSLGADKVAYHQMQSH